MTRELRLPARRDPAVAAVARRWRELTSGRLGTGRLGAGERTLIACSGGADSNALVLALAAVTKKLVIAHVVHDLRPEAEALADRDAVKTLAAAVGIDFVESRVSTKELLIDGHVAPSGLVRRAGDRNAEGLARRLRYLALAGLAKPLDIRFVATAHHAGDQLESMLLALMRGGGPRGLSGIAPSRSLVPGVRVVRPMLEIGRDECERLCRDAGWEWREDATNADVTRLRSFLRHRVVPELRAARPGVEERAAASAGLLRDAAALIGQRAEALLDGSMTRGEPVEFCWERSALRAERGAVIGEVIRRAARRMAGDAGMDQLGRASLDRVIEAVRSTATHPRRFMLRSIEVTVTSKVVTVRAREK